MYVDMEIAILKLLGIEFPQKIWETGLAITTPLQLFDTFQQGPHLLKLILRHVILEPHACQLVHKRIL